MLFSCLNIVIVLQQSKHKKMETQNNSHGNSLKNGIFLQEQIDTLIFNHLVNNITLDPDSDLSGIIAFASEHEEWSMTFFSESDTGFHRVIVQDFGFKVTENGAEKWVQCRPTSEQLSVLQSIVDKQVDQFESYYAEEENQKRIAASYDVRAEQGLFTYGY